MPKIETKIKIKNMPPASFSFSSSPMRMMADINSNSKSNSNSNSKSNNDDNYEYRYSSNSASSLQQEWEKLKIGQQRLSLQQERLKLEQELLKTEKRNWKRGSKLRSSAHSHRDSNISSNTYEYYSNSSVQGDDQSINSMNSQIQIVLPTSPLASAPAAAAAVEEEKSKSKSRSSSSSTSSSLVVRELREQLAQAHSLLGQKNEALAKLERETRANNHPRHHSKELLESLQEQLAATQRSLANVLVEKDTIQHERDALEEQVAVAQQQQQQRQRQPQEEKLERHGSLCSNGTASRCHNCADQQLEIQQLQDDLQNMKLAYANAQARSAQQSREWQVKQQNLTESHQSKLEERQQSLIALQQEKEALESELQQLREEALVENSTPRTVSSAYRDDRDDYKYWKDEAERLQQCLDKQNRQLEDWKLLVPRNKILLEQAIAKQESIQTKYYHMEAQYKEQKELVQQLQATNEALVQNHKALEQENHQLQEQQPPASSDILAHTNSPMDCQMENYDPSVLEVVIPLDDPNGPLRKLVRDGFKFVVEWEWTSKTGLYGMYTGWLDLTGNPHGHGTLRIEDGSIYDGDWKRGLRDGTGVYTSIDGDLYRGSWRNDKQHGRGCYVWPDGQIYTGDYVDGLRKGKGIETWPHGAKYEGEYHDDRRNGLGTYWYADGRCYSGEYKDDRPDGQGKQTDSDGSVLYDGEWNLGEFING